MCVADVYMHMLFSSGFSSAAEERESDSLESFTEEHRAILQEHQCCSERPHWYVQKKNIFSSFQRYGLEGSTVVQCMQPYATLSSVRALTLLLGPVPLCHSQCHSLCLWVSFVQVKYSAPSIRL